MDRLLNQKDYDPLDLATWTLAYYTKAVLRDKKKMELIEQLKEKDISPAEALDALKVLFDFSGLDGGSPFLDLVLNAVTRDHLNNKLVDTDFSRRCVSILFAPPASR